MIALCLDDEAPLLSALLRAAQASPDITQAIGFRKCSEALAWAEQNRPDVAFLDIQLRGMTGLEFATRLRERYPDVPIVFCTGYREFAFDAFQMHVSGYLAKPIRPEDVQKEIDNIKGRVSTVKRLTAQCFGDFAVFAQGKPLNFARKRSKELLAVLIDRRGATISAKDICVTMWEDDDNMEKNLQVFYKLLADLRNALSEVGAEEVLIRNKQEYAVDAGKIDCDYYRYLADDPVAVRSYRGEYMRQYSWAEETAATLD